MAFQPEPDAALRLLRWTRFVDSEAQTFAALFDAFTQATGVPIQFASESFEDLRPKAAVAASIGSRPDIIWGLHADAHLYANAMLDVTDVADRLGQKHGGWCDVAELYGTRDGKWIMLPFVFSGVLLNYRGSMLVRAGFDGVPDNTDDFLRLAKALKKNGTPMGMPLGNASGDGNTWCHWLLWAFGGKVADENDNVVLDSPETVAALEYARELAENFIPGVESWLDSNNNKVFLAGDISLTNNSISIYAAARQQGLVEIAEDIHHAAYPVGPVGRRTELHVLFPFMLYSYTRYPNAAKALAMWLLEKPQYDRLIRAAVGYLSPTLPALKDNPVWAEDAKRLPFRDVAEFALPFSHADSLGNAASSVFADFIVVTMVAEAASGAKTPQQAARDARARAERYYRT
jgi:multiple sugar transport system substrate-binding protein